MYTIYEKSKIRHVGNLIFLKARHLKLITKVNIRLETTDSAVAIQFLAS